MKSILLFAGAMTALTIGAQAQTATTPAPAPAAAAAPAAPAAPAPDTITFTPTWVSNYMFRGVRLGGSSFEPSIEYDSGNWGVGVWINVPIANKVPGQSDPEVDPYLFYTCTINDSLSIVPGGTIYTYPRAEGANGFYNDTLEPSLAINYTVSGLKLTPKVYYDVVLEALTGEITAGYTIPLKDAGTELDLTAQYGGYTMDKAIKNASPNVKLKGDYYLVGVSVPYQLGKTKITIGYAYTGFSTLKTTQGGFSSSAPTVAKSVVSASLSWTF